LVLTDQPLKNALQKLDALGWLLKWAVELSCYDLAFEPRRAIKAQALADFLAENTTPTEEGDLRPWPWNLYVDCSSTKDGSGVGLIIESSTATRYEYALKFVFKVSNNEAEYDALIARIELCYTMGADSVQACSDTQLVISQLSGITLWPPMFDVYGR